MKKIIFTILILLILCGCKNQNNIGALDSKDSFIKEELKADKENILLHKNAIDENGKTIKVYDYVSDKKVIGKDKYFKKGESFTNIKNITAKGTTTVLDLWVGDKYYKDENGDVYEIEQGATTTIENFEYQTATTTIEKIISFLGIKRATAQTVADYYVGAGDGKLRYYPNSNWNTVHDATTATDAYPTNSTSDIESGKISTNYIIYRSLFPIDTSAIPSGATISSSTMYFTSNGYNDGDNDAYAYIGLVQTSQASETTLTTADYNNVGSTNNPTKGAPDIDIAEWGINNVMQYKLNATGLTWIKKSGEASNCGTDTGWTCFGLREGHDIEDVAPGGRSYVVARTSEYTDTASDPYLKVVYSEAGEPTVEEDIEIFTFN